MSGHRPFTGISAELANDPAVQKHSERVRDELRLEDMRHARSLRELRTARDMTQKHLAAQLSVDQAQVSRLERQPDLYLSTMRKFLAGLGGHASILVQFDDDEPVLLDLEDLAGGTEAAAGEASTASGQTSTS